MTSTLTRSYDRVNLGGIVLADIVDSQLAHHYAKTGRRGPLLFDFENARFIDVAALVNCIAALVYRKRLGLESYISYPKMKRVRDFLRVWRFQEAVADALGLSLWDILLPEQRGYLTERQDTYSGVGDGIDALEYDPDWDGTAYTKRNFFEFTTFSGAVGQSISPEGPLGVAPRSESRRWTGALIREVLRKHLGEDKPRDDVARVIVYEAMSNAVRHPNASIIQTVSIFTRKLGGENTGEVLEVSPRGQRKMRKIEGSLRICVWDDGEDIVQTLLKPLRAGKSVRLFRLEPYMCGAIRIELRTFDERVERAFVTDQSEDPTLESSEAEILLSSLYPGVSRATAELVPEVDPYQEGPLSDDWGSRLHWAPGMGLYALCCTVLDQFQGTLFVRSGNQRLIMEVAHDAYRVKYNVRYKCRITSYPESFPRFEGNLLVIQLPIKS